MARDLLPFSAPVTACGTMVLVGTFAIISAFTQTYEVFIAAPFLPNLHVGYAVVAITMLPIVGLAAWVFQPHIAEHAKTRGVMTVGGEETTTASADD